MRTFFLAILLAAGLPGGAEVSRAATVPGLLTNAMQVLNLSASQAGQALPVRLRGVVVDEAEPRARAAILWDRTAGIYVSSSGNLFAPFRRRDVLEIKGVTSPGEFAPCILASEVQKVGTNAPPAPQPVTYQQLITGSLDAQYVEITGVVRQCTPATDGGGTWRIVVAADGGLVPVRIPLPQDPQIQADTEITIQAVCLYQFNQKRQALSPVLQVPRGVAVQVKKFPPADPYAEPLRSSDSLLQYSPEISFGHRLHVRGVVTHSQPDALVWIRDASSGLRIQLGDTNDLQPGDEIDALGFAVYGSSAPVIEDAIYRKISLAPRPLPLLLTNVTEAADHQDDLVSLEATLAEVQPSVDGVILTLKQKNTDFKAVWKSSPAANRPPAWQPGSRVRVAGICVVPYDDSHPVMGIWHPVSFQILLRSPDDLTVLQSPPWWTARHVVYLLGLLTGASVLVSGVILLVARRRLNDQARRRAMAEAEFSAILNERNRLAREIHDTLAQGLTATSVQLQLVKIHAGGASAAADQHLDLAQQMVRESLEEARNTIWNMRPQVLETGDLVTALKNILQQMSAGNGLATYFDITGRERRLPAVIENNVLRLGQEAVTNAVKHAQAKKISVWLEFGEKHFALVVADDGRGFDPAKPPRSAGGFGLLGMRDRAKELKGRLDVLSPPAGGTEIHLWIPLSGE